MYEPEKKNAANTVGVLLKIIFSSMAKDKVKVSVRRNTLMDTSTRRSNLMWTILRKKSSPISTDTFIKTTTNRVYVWKYTGMSFPSIIKVK